MYTKCIEKTLAKFVYPNNGYEADVERANILKKGHYYEVEGISMGQSRTSITLKNLRGSFNSVQFEFYDNNKQALDIYTVPEYNHYLSIFRAKD